MRKPFSCGHRGRGQYCHRCRQELDAIRFRTVRRGARQELAERLGVAAGEFPERILRRAAVITQQIQADGLPAMRALGAKKILSADGILSVPIGRRYRLLFAVNDDVPRYLELLTHEQYDQRLVMLRQFRP